MAFARMAESVGNSFLIIVLPLFIASDAIGGGTFGLTEAAITGFVLALFGLVNSPLQPITGHLSDRTGRRKGFLLGGLGLLSVASFAFAVVDTYWHLFALRVLQGVAGALIVPSSIALVNDRATDEDRGGNMGTYNAFRLIGFGVGPVAAGGVLAAGPYSLDLVGRVVTGFELAFAVAGVTALIGFGTVAIYVSDPPVESTTDEESGTAIAVFDRSGSQFLDPVFALGILTFMMAVAIAMFATLGDLVNTRLEQTARMFGLQFAAFVFALILFQAPIGRATDFYGRRRFIIAGAILSIPTTAAQGFVLDSWLMFAVRFAQGIAAALVFGPALALAGDLAPSDGSGGTLSILTMSFGLGIAVGPLLSGVLVGWGFAVPFVVGAGLATVGAIVVTTQVDGAGNESVS